MAMVLMPAACASSIAGCSASALNGLKTMALTPAATRSRICCSCGYCLSSWWIHFASDTCPETSACALAVQSCSSRKPLPMPKLFEKPILNCFAAAEPDGAAADPAADGAAADGAAADGAAALGAVDAPELEQAAARMAIAANPASPRPRFDPTIIPLPPPCTRRADMVAPQSHWLLLRSPRIRSGRSTSCVLPALTPPGRWRERSGVRVRDRRHRTVRS